MATITNRRVVLAARPKGGPKSEDFRFEEAPARPPVEGEVLLRTLFLSLDPYMRGRMNEAKSYAPSVELGQVMVGAAVCEVVESKSSELAVGAVVVANAGWQQYATLPATQVRKIDDRVAPPSAWLGALGMPGMTAYTGLLNIGQPKAGETVVVSAAAGAVGSVAGQIARLKGCRVVGVAGGRTKCDHVVNDLRFDACVDYKNDTFADDLASACPAGVDVYFENVGGKVFDALLPLLNTFARVPVCGRIASYNQTMPVRGIDRVPMLLGLTLVKRLTFRGFIVTDFAAQHEAFLTDMTGWLQRGDVRYREHIVNGFDHVVEAFQ
ncbi:MAG: NADP-dependent oxidoreductase, partial [Bacteroidales bacterium]